MYENIQAKKARKKEEKRCLNKYRDLVIIYPKDEDRDPITTFQEIFIIILIIITVMH